MTPTVGYYLEGCSNFFLKYFSVTNRLILLLQKSAVESTVTHFHKIKNGQLLTQNYEENRTPLEIIT